MPIILILLALMIFCLEVMIPSFGMLTLLGLILGGAGVFSAFSIDTFYGWCTLTLGIIGMPIAYYLGFRILKATPMVLNSTVGEPPSAEEKPPRLRAVKIGDRGVASTDIRPMGTARFGKERVEVTSAGEIIPAETALEIVEINGRQVRVRAVTGK